MSCTRKSRAGLAAGFTLLELLIVVVILGTLAAVIIPRFTVSATEAKRNT